MLTSDNRPLRIAVAGGGPGGLYFSLLMKKANPQHQVTVFERNAPDSTFGWGVVFSDQTLENFRAADSATYRQIFDNFAYWDDIDVHFKGARITSGGHGFSGIARKKLLNILQERCRELKVELRFNTEVCDVSDISEQDGRDAACCVSTKKPGDSKPNRESYDLVVVAEGINSAIRRKYAEHFQPELELRPAKFIWLGTTYKFKAFTFYFVQNQHGIFQAHCYRFDDNYSTFIVECDELSWRNAGFDRMDAGQTIAACEAMFAAWLDGHPLLFNATHQAQAPWTSFLRVRNEHWFHNNIVLLGDAAHTAHFSIGSGTKLAMEDAISLSDALSSQESTTVALERYEEERKTEALRLQNAARNSMEWFENVRRYVNLDPEQFTYSLLTRSQRVSHENLRIRDQKYLYNLERWFARRASGKQTERAIPPMFTPFTLRDMTVVNRVVVSPMDMYSAVDGTPTDFHLVHLGARALGGAGLIITEMTCISPEARISLGCTGMYSPEHESAWRKIVDFVHNNSRAKIALQLGHSGRKGSTKLAWEGMDEPLESGNWEVIAPSAIPYSQSMHTPRQMTRADMDKVLSDFVRAARMGAAAGFDMLELHCAHGYLLSSFITPLANRRTDEYGGSLENRPRFPLEVFRAMRSVWPAGKPMSVRISATDWAPGGVEGPEAVEIARAFHRAGADIIHVSTGQTSVDARPQYGRMYQTPYSERIRNEAGIPTIAVGNITEADQVNAIIAAGRADLCALARPHLVDPNWTLHAAAQLGYADQHWPQQYLTGKQQLERAVQRAKESKA
ncbi:MAG TPA: bifunctional salicylyl-CoA 5-hydroxylase/oxidoreductase [Terriglobales bacterium]|jgi:anthraniloyl-CoA monooxygenase|nr:bifunctional salicylyl-CoA 5-hydroxylase/oxidoreductase [Terriglobales bacterium]